MEFRDYYEVLGVARDATEKQIRAAFRKLARKHHPDINPGDRDAEERFKQINEAYEVLTDPEKRARYDELGARWRDHQRRQQTAGYGGAPFDWSSVAGAGAGPDSGSPWQYRSVSEEDLSDLFGDASPFSDFFQTFFTNSGDQSGPSGRGRTRRATAQLGTDLEHPLEISLRDAYSGSTRQLELRQPDGRTRRLEVKIPPGVRTGSRVRVAGQGAEGRDGGHAGDLYLVITVQPDPRFERRGDDLHAEVRVPWARMLLGGETRVPTPDERTLALTVPPGTQDGRIFRLRGQGMPRLGRPSSRGDLHVALHVTLPEKLSARARELVEELAADTAGERVGSR